MKSVEGKRFKQALDVLGIKQREVASILHCDETYVSRMAHGKVTITLKNLYRLKGKFPLLNIDFIKKGTGAPVLNAVDSAVSEGAEKYNSEADKDKIIESLLDVIKIYQSREREIPEAIDGSYSVFSEHRKSFSKSGVSDK